MITVKIRRLDDDKSEPKRNKGSAADERATMAALARKSGKSFYHVKTRAKRPGRGTPGGKGKSASRPRHEHLRDYAAIAEYLIEGNEKGEHPDGEGRVERITSFGVPGIEDGAPLSLDEFNQVRDWMGETAAQNTRIKKSSVLHYVVSLPPEEKHKATPEFWNMVTLRVMNVLDLSEHQTLAVEHCDTDHSHVHIVINRVHPTTHKAASPFQDMYKLEALNHQIAKERGLKKVVGRLIDPDTGEPYTVAEKIADQKLKDKQKTNPSYQDKNVKVIPGKRRPTGGAQDFKKRALKKLKDDKPFSNSQSWEELEVKFAEHGYHLDQKGGGMVLVQTDLPKQNAKGEKQFTELKVSAIAGKGKGGSALEKQFGETWADYQFMKTDAKDQGCSIAVVRMQHKVRAENERTDQTSVRRAKAEVLAHQIASIWPVGPDTKRCGVGWGCESETELRGLITPEMMPNADMMNLLERTRLKNEEAKAGMERTANQSAEALKRAGEVANHGDWFSVELGTEKALRWLEVERDRRRLVIPNVEIPEGNKTTAKVEPFLIDMAALKLEQTEAKERLKALDKVGLEQILDANQTAITDVKKQPSTPQNAKRQRMLTEGVRVIRAEFTERGWPVPDFKQEKVKTKQNEPSR